MSFDAEWPFVAIIHLNYLSALSAMPFSVRRLPSLLPLNRLAVHEREDDEQDELEKRRQFGGVSPAPPSLMLRDSLLLSGLNFPSTNLSEIDLTRQRQAWRSPSTSSIALSSVSPLPAQEEALYDDARGWSTPVPRSPPLRPLLLSPSRQSSSFNAQRPPTPPSKLSRNRSFTLSKQKPALKANFFRHALKHKPSFESKTTYAVTDPDPPCPPLPPSKDFDSPTDHVAFQVCKNFHSTPQYKFAPTLQELERTSPFMHDYRELGECGDSRSQEEAFIQADLLSPMSSESHVTTNDSKRKSIQSYDRNRFSGLGYIRSPTIVSAPLLAPSDSPTRMRIVKQHRQSTDPTTLYPTSEELDDALAALDLASYLHKQWRHQQDTLAKRQASWNVCGEEKSLPVLSQQDPLPIRKPDRTSRVRRSLTMTHIGHAPLMSSADHSHHAGNDHANTWRWLTKGLPAPPPMSKQDSEPIPSLSDRKSKDRASSPAYAQITPLPASIRSSFLSTRSTRPADELDVRRRCPSVPSSPCSSNSFLTPTGATFAQSLAPATTEAFLVPSPMQSPFSPDSSRSAMLIDAFPLPPSSPALSTHTTSSASSKRSLTQSPRTSLKYVHEGDHRLSPKFRLRLSRSTTDLRRHSPSFDQSTKAENEFTTDLEGIPSSAAAAEQSFMLCVVDPPSTDEGNIMNVNQRQEKLCGPTPSPSHSLDSPRRASPKRSASQSSHSSRGSSELSVPFSTETGSSSATPVSSLQSSIHESAPAPETQEGSQVAGEKWQVWQRVTRQRSQTNARESLQVGRRRKNGQTLLERRVVRFNSRSGSGATGPSATLGPQSILDDPVGFHTTNNRALSDVDENEATLPLSSRFSFDSDVNHISSSPSSASPTSLVHAIRSSTSPIKDIFRSVKAAVTV